MDLVDIQIPGHHISALPQDAVKLFRVRREQQGGGVIYHMEQFILPDQQFPRLVGLLFLKQVNPALKHNNHTYEKTGNQKGQDIILGLIDPA
jgi:hypothetical protein